ncbi:MAG: hypothetical protein FGF52_03095 [Candidatus Brockarchaeota archaeon]|nr:hypothetical protein [Candidatus Brockarchaeota archaeon]
MEEASLLALPKKFSGLAWEGTGFPAFKHDFRKNFGLINFYIIPVDDNENIIVEGTTLEDGFTVYVHNYTGFFRKPVEGRINEGKNPVPVRVWRVVDNLTGDWVEQEYVIVLITQNYFGTGLIKVKPDKPVMNIQVKIRVSKKVHSYVCGESLKPPISPSGELYPPIKNSIVEEEVSRIRKYLAMLDNERRRGSISEEAYNRLRQRLESMLYEILFEEGVVSSKEELEDPGEEAILQQ